jgi:hypothetical protein
VTETFPLTSLGGTGQLNTTEAEIVLLLLENSFDIVASVVM